MITLHLRPILAIAAVAFVGLAVAYFANTSRSPVGDKAANDAGSIDINAAPARRIEAHEMVEDHAAAIAESFMASPKPIADIKEKLKRCAESDLVVTLRAISMTVPAVGREKYSQDELSGLSQDIIRLGMGSGQSAVAAFNTLLSLVESGATDAGNLSALVESDEAEVRKRTLFWALSTPGEHATLTVRKALNSAKISKEEIAEVLTLVGQESVRANHSALSESEFQSLVGGKQK